MNIQIFGTKKCFDTKKAERYFKERNIKYQFIDLKEKGMSKGELTSVLQSIVGADESLCDAAEKSDLYRHYKGEEGAGNDRDKKGSWICDQKRDGNEEEYAA